MRDRVAKTKTETTAWKLVELLTKETDNNFVVVLRAPDSGFEIVPTGPVHTIDHAIIKKVVAAFKG